VTNKNLYEQGNPLLDIDEIKRRVDELERVVLTRDAADKRYVGTSPGGFTGTTSTTLDGLDDVSALGAGVGDYLRYSGSEWQDQPLSQLIIDLAAYDGAGSGLDADLLDGVQLIDIQAEIDADIATHAADASAHHAPVTVNGLGLSLAGQDITLTSSDNPGLSAKILATSALGELTIAGVLNTAQIAAGGDILPIASDAYDLGSSTLLWRKIWASEFDSVIFSQNAITVTGGWWLIPHSSGTLQAGVSVSDTTIDFGSVLANGDYVLLRGAGQVEYMQVGSLVSGTTYNVTRNLDGSGANSWPSGHVWVSYGQSGDGRIEFDAQTAGARMSLKTQGGAYNASTEMIRIGDLTGWGGGTVGYGIAIGDPAGDRLTYDSTNGLIIAGDGSAVTNINGGNIQTGTVTATQINVSQLSALSANLGTVTAGTITGVTINAGTLSSGVYPLVLDSNGLTLDANIGKFSSASIDWVYGATTVLSVGTQVDLGTPTAAYIQTASGYSLNISAGTSLVGNLTINGDFALYGGGVINGDLSITNNLSASMVNVTGNYEKNGTVGYIYVPFSASPVQPTGWAGAAKTSGTYTVNRSDFAGVPSGAVAVHLQIGITGGTAGNYITVGYNAYADAIAARIQAGTYAFETGLVNFYSGQIKVYISGAVTAYIRCIGYYV